MYNVEMAKHVINVSEAEAASDFASLMGRVRSGAEIVIESGTRSRGRSSSCRTLAPHHLGVYCLDS
jgi:hypothetical protein